MDWFARDLRTGLRLLARDKAYSLTAATTLALCLGANTALFSVVHHVLLRPLPVPEPERILLMSNQYPGAGASDSSNSGVPDYYDRLRETSVYDEQALFNTREREPRRGRPARARRGHERHAVVPARDADVHPRSAAPFTNEEGEPGNEKKVLLSDALWRSQFGADPGAVGKDLRIDGQPYTVVGVMPRAFEALAPGHQPLAAARVHGRRRSPTSAATATTGGTSAGSSRARRSQQAQAQVDALNAANLERFPQYKELLVNAGFRTKVAPLPGPPGPRTSSRSSTCSGAARCSCC